MGSSIRSDLNSGRMIEWEDRLREAVEIIRKVRMSVWDCIGANGQYGDAGDDGALAERLSIAIDLIESELPPKPKAQS